MSEIHLERSAPRARLGACPPEGDRRTPTGPPLDPRVAGVPIQRADRQRPAYSGKVLAQRIVPELEAAAEPALAHDSSTNALIRRYLALRDGASQEKTG